MGLSASRVVARPSRWLSQRKARSSTAVQATSMAPSSGAPVTSSIGRPMLCRRRITTPIRIKSTIASPQARAMSSQSLSSTAVQADWPG
ncbi:hypothetical protein D3C87_2002110 [compost metagenome]